MKNEDDLSPGLGLGITFIIIGCIIPWLFSNNFMLLISTLIVAIGIGGTGIEIAKLTQKNEFQYLSVGLAFILISIYFLTIINNSWGRAIFLIISFFGLLSIICSIVKMFFEYKNKKMKVTKKLNIWKIVSAIFELTGFIVNIITILTKFHLLKF